jgi:radical SAM superfamily enzyme YgiQ (UPF0313 family)
MKIYLCDLTHEVGLRTRVVPLGIGTLACALKDAYSDQISTKLFVYPKKIIKELKSNPPEILALSNYIWNSKLSLKIAKIAKKINPKILTVMGGPHCRSDKDGMKTFLNKYPQIDAYIPFEGESPIIELIGKCLNTKVVEKDKLGSVQGTYLNIQNYNFERLLVKSDKTKQVYNSPYYTINQFTSPYLSGMLDEFLDDPQLSPLLESNRGCPYSCTFCAWGIGSGNKLIKKDLHKFVSEMWYIGKRTRNDVWFLADANFGMVEDDVTIATELKKINNKYGSPKTFEYHTAKNTAKMVFKVANILGDSAPINVAVQSFDPEVLKKIKRKNLKNHEIQEFIKMHQDQGRTVVTDILVPLSGDTMKSHLNSLRTAMQFGFDKIHTNIIRMLPGVEMESDADRKKYGFKTLWRPMDSGYGIYDGEFIFETDESIMETNDITINEMYFLKKIHFLSLVFSHNGFAVPLLKLALKNNINPVDIFVSLAKDLNSDLSKKILIPLENEFKNEWFKSEEDLINHYSKPEVYEDLFKGEIGMQRLNLKYMTNLLVDTSLLNLAMKTIKKYILKNSEINNEIIDVVYKISVDNWKLDPLDPELTKIEKYITNEKNLKYIQEAKIVPKSAEYKNGGFELVYNFPEDKFKLYSDRLKQLNYKDNPKNAIYTAMSIGIAKYLYKLRTNSEKNIYQFEKNPFQRLEETPIKQIQQN